MPAAVPRLDRLDAATHWRSVEFISDLHLREGDWATFAAWERFLSETQADAVFILGDLFEVWVGDDAVQTPQSFEAKCAEILRVAAQRRALYFMHGNRDFLLSGAFLQSLGVTLLDDPIPLDFGKKRWLLSHGDALCLGDTDYMQFRAMVRAPGWQRDFLALPLAQRKDIARDMRAESEARKQAGQAWSDVDATAARECLVAAQASTLIHGHTHRPDSHDLGAGLQRVVLSDWDFHAQPPRADALRLGREGTLQRLPLA